MSADYLFQQDKHYDVGYDTGDKVIQCGRHNDIFKFWLMWRAKVKNYLCTIIKNPNRHLFAKRKFNYSSKHEMSLKDSSQVIKKQVNLSLQ